MAAVTQSRLTLADLAKLLDPDGSPAVLAELLAENNEILDDIVWKEANDTTGERVSVRTKLPTVYTRRVNEGVARSKSMSAQLMEACTLIEAWSEIDAKLVEFGGNALRMTEDLAFIEAMKQKFDEMLIKGNPGDDPNAFRGLQLRYGNYSTAGNSQNVISAGGSGTGTFTSIYLVGWSTNTVYCTYPKGTQAGLKMENLGRAPVYTDAASIAKRMMAYTSRFEWNVGLAVKDWRNVVRICNIDVADALARTATQATTVGTNIIYLMNSALACIPNRRAVNLSFYMNRTLFTALTAMGLDKSQQAVTIQPALRQFGDTTNLPNSMTTFLGVPVRMLDVLDNVEAAVPA